jgi:hypothetical protein
MTKIWSNEKSIKEMRMKMKKTLVLGITAGLTVLPLIGACQSEQKAEEPIDSLEGSSSEEGGGDAKKADHKKGKKGKKAKKAKKK